ncbi:MAG: hypothetical protein EBQ96_07945 [Proteobacteria bacterium]|nr:hypothetical protein [Pseudomonadota bacterium]
MSKTGHIEKLAAHFAARKVFMVGVDLQARYLTPFLAPVYEEAERLSDGIAEDVSRRILVRHNSHEPKAEIAVRVRTGTFIRDKYNDIATYTNLLNPEKKDCKGHAALVYGVYAGNCVYWVLKHSLLPYGFKPYVCLDAIDIRREHDALKPKSTEELRRIAQAMYGPRVGILTRAEIMAARDLAKMQLAA